MKTLEVSGSDYAVGKQIGSCFREILRAKASEYEKYLKQATVSEYIGRELAILRGNMPGLWEELSGRSDGAGVSVELITLMTSDEILRTDNGCTTVIVKKDDGSVLFSHNEDEDDFTRENSVLIVRHDNGLEIAAYTNARKLPGSAVGWNSAGMIFTSNFLFYEKADLNRVSRYIASGTVYRAGSLQEAVGMLRCLKTASPFSMNVFDTNAREAVNVEKDRDTCYVTAVTGKFSHSNHFLNREAPKSVSSAYRLDRTRELLCGKEIRCLKDITDILDDTGEDREHTVHIPGGGDAQSRTVINLACDSKEKIITVRDFLDGTVSRFRAGRQ